MKRLLAIAALLLCTATYAQVTGGTITGGMVVETSTVTVDFSETGTTFANRMAGWLGHVDDGSTGPSTQLLETDLEPFAWRDPILKQRMYTEVVANNGVYTYVICNCANCDVASYDEPWGADQGNWETLCAARATTYSEDLHPAMNYDYWNEADTCPGVWNTGTGVAFDEAAEQDQYSDAMHYCYDAIAGATSQAPRMIIGSMLSLNVIMGWLCDTPSDCATAWNASSYVALTGSPDYTTHSGLAELNTNAMDIDLGVHLFIQDDYVMLWEEWIDDVRGAIADEISDSSLTTLEGYWSSDASGLDIHVQEYTGNTATQILAPGHKIVAIGKMHEDTGIISGNVACWNDPNDASSACTNKTIGGALRPDGGTNPDEKRPLHWLWNWYSDLTGDEALVTSTNARLDGVAAGDDTAEEYRVLLGLTGARSGTTYPAGPAPRVTLNLSSMPPSCTVNVKVQHIQVDDYEGEFGAVDLYEDSTTPTSTDASGDLSVTLTIGTWDVVYVVVDTFVCS